MQQARKFPSRFLRRLLRLVRGARSFVLLSAILLGLLPLQLPAAQAQSRKKSATRASASKSKPQAVRSAPAPKPKPKKKQALPEPKNKPPRRNGIDSIEEWTESLRKAEAEFGEEWSAFARDMETGEVILNYKGDDRLIPASTRKLMVFALAMEKLGPEYTFKTEFGLTRSYGGSDGTLNATAILRSNGDPSMSGRFLNGKNPGNVLRSWVRELSEIGVRRLQGDFIIDASAFGGEQDQHPRGWGEDHVGQSYAPLPSAIALNDNLVTIRLNPGPRVGSPATLFVFPAISGMNVVNQTSTRSGGSTGISAGFDDAALDLTLSGGVGRGGAGVTIPLKRPLTYIEAIVRDELVQVGIEVAGSIKIVTDPAEGKRYQISRLLDQHQSPPLIELLHIMLRESDNFLAEQIWRAAAYRVLGRGDMEAARDLERGWYRSRQIGSMEPGYDGSGLSRQDRVSASEWTTVLQAVYSSPYRPYLLDCLPESGRTGTLRNKNLGVPPGRVVAKTGTLTGVGSLAGFIRDARGQERWVFSLIGNSPTHTNGRLTWRENQIMKVLTDKLDAKYPSAFLPSTARQTGGEADAVKRGG